MENHSPTSKPPIRLGTSRRYLSRATLWYRRHGGTLSPEQLENLEECLENLEVTIHAGRRSEAHDLVNYLKEHFPHTIQRSVGMTALKTLFAFVVLVLTLFVMRQSWLELYQIPTGSMRPTFREGDHFLLTKTAFGLNWPFQTKHLYFDPKLVNRTGIVVWSGEGIDLPDSASRYIKRVIGKPGDTLYFYGGKVFGIDRDGRDISTEYKNSWMEGLEYIPFSSFEGRITTASAEGSDLVYQIMLNQMGQPVGRLTLAGYGVLEGDVSVQGEWVEDNPLAQRVQHNEIETYMDFWGMRNYAMTRLLTKDQVHHLTDIDPSTLEEATLYLELRHSPNLTLPKPRFQEGPDGRIRFLLTPHVTVIPLQDKHLVRLMDNMYTSRFIVQDGRAGLFGIDGGSLASSSPMFTKVPDGIYEYYHGKAYSVDWSGTLTELERSHPLYRKLASNIQRLFNLGIEFDADFAPTTANQVDFPSRYAYFRDGDLYVLGTLVIRKDEPTMQYYVQHELERQRTSSHKRPYTAFLDRGAPVHDGRIDRRFVRTFGLHVPEGHYLVLGDNHARSVDSRYFGFIPEDNLLGAPSYILWPSGERWGVPQQPEAPWATLPRVFVWGVLWLVAAGCYFLYWIRLRRKIFQKVDFGQKKSGSSPLQFLKFPRIFVKQGLKD